MTNNQYIGIMCMLLWGITTIVYPYLLTLTMVVIVFIVCIILGVED